MNFKVKIFVYLVCCQTLSASSVNVVPSILSLYRYEGNFHPVRASRNVNVIKDETTPRYINQVELDHQIYHNVIEGVSPALSRQQQIATRVHPRPSEKSSVRAIPHEGNLEVHPEKKIGTLKESKVVPSSSVIRNYHDIFLKYRTPQELVFGHVLSWPGAAEKKIEKRQGNTYKGQVIWADRKGGYGEHYWDLAQGAL